MVIIFVDDSGEIEITFNDPKKGDIDLTMTIEGATALVMESESANPNEQTRPVEVDYSQILVFEC